MALGVAAFIFMLDLLLMQAKGQPELFKNPNFEENFNGEENWFCVGGCQLQKSSDAFTGSQSGEVTGRSANWHGVTQYVPVQPNRAYHFSLRLKILNQQSGALWHAAKFMFRVDRSGGGTSYLTCSTSPYMMQSEGWTRVGGDCRMPNTGITRARFYVEFPDTVINYRVDAASLKEILSNPSWRREADARIEQIRKRDMDIRVNAGPAFDPNDLEIVVQQTYSAFPFGSAVQADRISASDSTNQRYQQVFYDLFEMATLENAHKWQVMERNRGQIDYERPERAVDALIARGVAVRGHCITWGVERWVPSWLKPMSGDQIRQEVTRKINGVVGRFKDKLVHWDVNNEQIHGDFYEQKTRDPYYTHDKFRETRAVDGDVRLFYNDYNIVSGYNGDSTYAYTWSVQKAVEMGTPVDGMGIQAHFRDWFDPDRDIPTVWQRLEVAASAGVPVWVTELDYEANNRNRRADGYENLLRLFFSHPAVEGVVFWGFWDQAHWRPRAAMYEGNNITPNEAGIRVRQLIRETWRTNVTLWPTSRTQQFRVRGFLGEYELKVRYQGQEISSRSFSLEKGSGALVIDVQI